MDDMDLMDEMDRAFQARSDWRRKHSPTLLAVLW